jgi:hypothetical protein
MKEFGRKPYIAKSYDEMMKRVNNPQVWWAGIVEYHSEFEKPYADDSYGAMQHYRPSWPGISFDVIDFDFPIDPYGPIPDDYIFFCDIHPCFCPGESKKFEAKCTYEIIGVSGDVPDGISISYSKTSITITASAEVSDFTNFSINIHMRAPRVGGEDGEWVYGTHWDILVGECVPDSTCCDCAGESPSIGFSDETMTGGTTQELSVVDPGALKGGCLPTENEECGVTPAITLSCSGSVVDTFNPGITETGFGNTRAYFYTNACEGPNRHCDSGNYTCHGSSSGEYCVNVHEFNCYGDLINATYANYSVTPVGSDWNYSENCTSVAGSCTGGTGCDCIDSRLSANSLPTFETFQDERTAQMITDGCCPADLL